MRKRRAPETQNLLAAMQSKMAVKGASSEAIVHAFMKRYPEVIARESSDLVYTALMKYVANVGAVKGKSGGSAQFELFEEYRLPRTVLFQISDSSKMHRQLQSLTLEEGREHVLARTQPRARVPEDIAELARLLDDVEPYKVSDDSTIGDCWAGFREAKGR